MKRERTIGALCMPAVQRGGMCQHFLHANAAQCLQKWQCLACASMQLPGQSIVKKTTTCKSGIFLNRYAKRTIEYVTSHKAVENGWKLEITSIENQLFLTQFLTWIYKMPLLVSLTINDIYTAYDFKIIIQANKTLFGCRCLVLKNLKRNPPIGVFSRNFLWHVCWGGTCFSTRWIRQD